MSKIIVVGDVHGRDFWHQVAENEEYNFDHFIFLGDYFDNFPPFTGEGILHNFFDIVEFKNKYPDKVHMLIGNHDYHYMKFSPSRYSGYNHEFAKDIQDVVHDCLEKGLLMPAIAFNDLLFTHAGVGKEWFKNVAHLSPGKAPAEQINQAFKEQPLLFDFLSGGSSSYGEDPHQGPMWIRPDSLKDQMIDGYHQFIGHSHVPQISFYQNKEKKTLAMLDAPQAREYVVLDTEGDKYIHVKKA